MLPCYAWQLQDRGATLSVCSERVSARRWWGVVLRLPGVRSMLQIDAVHIGELVPCIQSDLGIGRHYHSVRIPGPNE